MLHTYIITYHVMGICKLQQAYVSHEYSLLLFIKAHIHEEDMIIISMKR